MKYTFVLLFLLILPVFTAQAADADFRNATLRIDYTHTGATGEEIVALDRIHEEGPWPGSRTHLIDTLDLGRYQAKLLDADTGRLIFSRGFDSYFGEWKTTGPAAEGVRRTYHESIRTPMPVAPVDFTLELREDGVLREVFRQRIDPASVELRHEPQPAGVIVVEAHIGGSTASCVDVAILGDGYTADDVAKFEADVRRFSKALLGTEPFEHMKDRFNVRGVLLPSQDRGCDEPTRGVDRRTALGCTFNSLGSERYMLTEDNRAIRDVAAVAPYDVLSIMVNSERYGGGGIYNLFNTFTSDNQWSEYVFVHEFGHGFGGLADEYYSSTTSYTGFYSEIAEPRERNITNLKEGWRELKWADLIESETPVDWNKAEFDAMDAVYMQKRGEINTKIASLMRGGAPQAEIDAAKAEGEETSLRHQQKLDEWFAANPAVTTVGLFEGAGYCSEGMYRAQLDCIMFTKGLKSFCAACSRGIEEVVAAVTD